MSKMIIYFYLLIPLFLSTDSSSIRGRNLNNDLVPLPSSKLESVKPDSNSLKILSSEPFILQIQIPKSGVNETKEETGNGKRRKNGGKKRVSKTKSMRKKHRNRRDLLFSKSKTRQERIRQTEDSHSINETDHNIKNETHNAINRLDILKALSLHSKRMKNIKDDEDIDKITHSVSTSNRNHHNSHVPHSERMPLVKMTYPTTPKLDLQPHKYTYQDLMADRERLEQKIKYIKNILNVTDSNTDDTVRVRRRSDSDRTANKIAKMFLTLSAVNGLHDKRKSKCSKDDGDEDDRVQDVWEKERKNSLFRKNSSSNEERYKVKKWIEYMKNKRSASKTCPCMTNVHGEDTDVFPLEQKLPKGYFLMERGRSSEESSESYRDPLYYSRDRLTRPIYRKQSQKTQEDQENKLKLGKNGKKKLDLPFDDLELYRSRAKQILRNAEEILDRIKEEEEKRLAAPNLLLSQLKELTAKIQGDPRNNENDLIRKIQKNLGWGPLAKSQENGDKNNLMDNVKSLILEPYEKAKALSDENTKKLSSYLLRNLGKLQESSEEQDEKNGKVYFEQVRQNEEKPMTASLAREDYKPDDPLSKHKEELRNWENTLSTILSGNEEPNQEEQYKQRMEEIIKEQQKKVNEHKPDPSEGNSEEIDKINFKSLKDKIKSGKGIVKGRKPESTDEVDDKVKDSQIVESKKDKMESKSPEEKGSVKAPKGITKKPFLGRKGTFRSEKGKSDGQASRNMQEEAIEEGEFEKEIEEIIKNANQQNGEGKEIKIKIEDEPTTDRNEDIKKLKKEKESEPKGKPEVVSQPSNIRINSGESTRNTNSKEDGDVVASPHFLTDEEDDFEAAPRFLAALNDFLYDDDKYFEIPEGPVEPQEKTNTETLKEKQEDPLKMSFDENTQETPGLKESPKDITKLSQTEGMKGKEIPDSLTDKTTQMEVDGEKNLQPGDLVKEPSQEIKTNKESNEEEEDENRNEETLKSERLDDDKINQTEEDLAERETPETGHAKQSVDFTKSKEIIENGERSEEEGQYEDPSLKMVLEKENDNQENQENQKSYGAKEDDSTLLKAEKSEESREENLSGETVLKNTEGTETTDDLEERLKAEKPTDDKNTGINREETLSKEANDSEEIENSKETSKSLLKAVLDNQKDENDVDETPTSGEIDEEVVEKHRNRNDDDTDEAPVERTLQEDDESSVKATKVKQNDSEEIDSSEDVQKSLSKENQEDDQEDEKTFLKSGKSVDDNSEDLKTSDNERETINEEENKTAEKSDESILEAMDPQIKETNVDEGEATSKAEESNEDETPLRSALNNKDQEEMREENLRMEKSDETQDEDLEERNSDETLKTSLDNQEENLEKTVEDETPLRMAKPDEEQDEDSDKEEKLKATLDKEDSEEDLPVRKEKPDEVDNEDLGGDMTVRKKKPDEVDNEDLEEDMTVRKEKPDEVGNEDLGEDLTVRKEKPDEVGNEDLEVLKEALDDQEERIEERNEGETPLKMSKTEEINEENSDETLKAALDNQDKDDVRMTEGEETEKENSKEKSGEETLKEALEDQNEEKLEDKTLLRKIKPDEVQDEDLEDKSSEERLKAALDLNQDDEKEETDEGVRLKMEKPEESDEEDKDETLKSSLDNQQKENLGENDDEALRMENNEEQYEENEGRDTVRAESENETQENLNEELNEETLKEVKPNDEVELRQSENEGETENQNMENETTSQETQSDEEGEQTVLKAVPDDQEQTKLNDETLLKAGNLNKDIKGHEIGYDSHEDSIESLRENQEGSREVNENVQLENRNDDDVRDNETPLRSTNLEDQLDNMIDYDKTLLKSAKAIEEGLGLNKNADESEESYREQEPDDLNNRIDEKHHNDRLKLVRFDDTNTGSEESLFETLKAVNPLEENLSEEGNRLEATNENHKPEISSSNLQQKPNFPTGHFKTGNLKVPKSIGKIMEDLNENEKGAVTSLQNLNPDKIDHIINKIDEAEQQTLLESQVDCRKECACADEIDTKSRNIGRYEIVKDILHWFKDLQLNRVLTDD